MAERLPGLIQPTDCCPLLIVLVGRDEVDEKSTRITKKDLKGTEEGTSLIEGTRGGSLDSFGSRDECQNEQENPWDQKVA